jgi:hypothetical protein
LSGISIFHSFHPAEQRSLLDRGAVRALRQRQQDAAAPVLRREIRLRVFF